MVEPLLDSTQSDPMTNRTIAFEYSLAELGLLSDEPDSDFDNLTQLASAILDAPVSLVSIIDYENDRQKFKSQTGLSEPWASRGETPLSHSFCQHVVSQNLPLVVADARQHPLVQSNQAINDLGVIAYLGIPVHTPDGKPIGALCAISGDSRAWSAADQQKLARVSASVNGLIRHRVAKLTSERLRKELQEFSAALSHDIKSPTSSLVLLHREIAESLGDAISTDVTQLLDLCRGATDRTTQLVENILSFTRLFESVATFESVDLTTLVKTVLSDLEGQIKQTNASIDVDALPMIRGSKALLHVLLTQLITNALLYSFPEQAPCIKISSQISSDGQTITLCIRDAGIGIAPQFHERVFQLFERLHLGSQYPGHGIGLTLCQRIVRIHSGAIEIVSTEGHGTQIIVDLPVTLVTSHD